MRNHTETLNREQIEIAKKFVDLHGDYGGTMGGVEAWTHKLERLTTSNDEAYQNIYFSLIGGEYGEVRCIVDQYMSVPDIYYEIEINSSESYSGYPVLFTFTTDDTETLMMQDEAYIWSVENQDAFNMMIVLSAWGFPCTIEDAIFRVESERLKAIEVTA